MKRFGFLLIYLAVSAVYCYGVDSHKILELKSELQHTRVESEKISLLIDIANEIKGFHPDSGYYYLNRARTLLPEIRSKKMADEYLIRIQLSEAAIVLTAGDYPKVLELVSSAMTKAQRIENKALEAHSLMTLGSYYYNQSDFHVADSINQLALNAVRLSDDRKLEGKILTNMGVVQFVFGNGAKADSLFRMPLQLAENEGDKDLMAASLLNIGLLHKYKGDMNTAIDFINQSAEIYELIGGKDGLTLCYQNLSSIFYNLGDYGNAIYFNKLNYDISAEIQDIIGMAKAAHNMGEAHFYIGDYEKALNYFLESIDNKKKVNNLQGIAVSSRSIGNLHFQQGELYKALTYYQESLKIHKETGDVINQAISLSDIGNVLFELNQIDSAWHYYMQAKDVFERNGYDTNLADVYLQISKVFYKKGDYGQAKIWCNKAEAKENAIGDESGLLNVWMIQSAILMEEAKAAGVNSASGIQFLKDALKFTNKAHETAIRNQLLPAQVQTAEKLMNIHQYLGNTSNALTYARMRLDVMDTLAKVQRAEALANAEIRWETRRKQEEIDRLESEKIFQGEIIQQQEQLNGRLNMLAVALGSIVILIVTSSILFVKNREKKKDILQQKYKSEITLLKMQNINNRLSPHLFFNMLGNVGGHVNQPEVLKENLTNISILLRKSLENSDKNAIPLADELDLVKSYVNLQKSHLPGFFKADFNVDEKVDMNVHIPSMMLQIPVENAIKHGLMPKDGDCELQVDITRSNSTLNITIEDNGVGRNASHNRTTGTGTGLKVLLQTIHLINQNNKEKVHFSIRDGEKQGTVVEIKIPYSCNYSW
jgi:tetratricopeptide (TPR) repeat protein/two-component sensor histidine kinase